MKKYNNIFCNLIYVIEKYILEMYLLSPISCFFPTTDVFVPRGQIIDFKAIDRALLWAGEECL